MTIQVVERKIIAQRGPTDWLAWLSDLPTLGYRGRSAPEAIGRLVCDLSFEFTGIPEIQTEGGMPLPILIRPLSGTALANARAMFKDWGLHPFWTERIKQRRGK